MKPMHICVFLSVNPGKKNFLSTLAALLQAFEVSTDGLVLDMTASFGLTNAKATSLEVLVKPRLYDVSLYS